jgi:hypothetical protein
MKAPSLKELKAELSTLSSQEVTGICLRLAKYKKENKELLAYLLFSASDEASYIVEVKAQMDEQFEGVNQSNLYLTKKMLRKILRTTNRFIKYSGAKPTEVELLIYFCHKVRNSGILYHTNKALDNLYQRLIIRIQKSISMLHEDLQYDYTEELRPLID